jgi:diacylglycerol O-acyltransferase / wax synthase
MPTRLTGMDATFLYLETRTSHMHVGGVLVLDPSTAPGGQLTYARMLDYLEERLHLAPHLRRRLQWVPFNLDHPLWIEDPDFDLGFHVRRAALPSPGGIAELAEFAGDVMSRPLDRGRPLWELHVIEGLEGGRLAVMTKTHHAAIDGVSGAQLLAALLQLAPDQEAPPPERPWAPERPRSDARLLAEAGLRLAATPLQVLRTGGKALSSLPALVRLQRGQKAPPAPFAAPMTVLNGAIGPRRKVVLAELSLDTVKDVKNCLGGTVNDVVLAAVAGTLRGFLLGRGEAADQPLVAMVPISVRPPGREDDLGNHVSAMLVSLPVDEPDAVARLEAVRTSTSEAKEQHGALGATTIQELAEVTPAAAAALAARLYTGTHAADRHRPIWNLVVSNVPGPRFPLYTAGARLEAMYPLGPCHEMVGLNVTLFSYQDTVYVGVNTDIEMLPDAEEIARGLQDAVAELEKAAAERRR